jgi:branched-chain amino acid transport system substrate-binding protein
VSAENRSWSKRPTNSTQSTDPTADEVEADRKTRLNSASDKSATLSRREFLKVAGIAGATIGVAGGLGGLVAACGGTEETTTTAGPVTTAGPATTTTTAGVATTVTTAAEVGKQLKIGLVVPKTGALSTFMAPFDWVSGQWTKILADGVVCGDGKSHAIKMSVQDTQSDTNRCAQVSGDLILNEKVDIIFAAGAPDTMNPAADQCEALACPGLMAEGPWQAFFFGRQKDPAKPVPFKWGYALCVGVEAMAQCFLEIWDQISTNKKVGTLFHNSPDGQAWADEKSGGPFFYKKDGYTLSSAGFFQPGTEDYTQQISQFKKFGAEILAGVMVSADFTNLWKQSLQQGFKPKIGSIGQALTFAATLEAIGPSARGLTSELAWHRDYPYKSSFTGQTCTELAEAYEADTGKQYCSGMELYSLMELYVYALKQAADPTDKEAVIKAISTAKLDTMYGPVDFTMPVDPTADTPVTHPVPNCLRMPTAACQWLKGDKYPFKQVLVSARYLPAGTVVGKPVEMQYS